MKKIGLQILLSIIALFNCNAQTEIVINEFSQGSDGTKEWVELVITADGTNIQGVYCSDDEGGFSNIDFQLKTDLATFSSVSKGSIIVVYNGADKDGTLPDDDTNFGDGIIVIPHDNTTFIETGSSWPGFGNPGDDFGIFTGGGVGIHGISYNSGTPTTDFDGGWGQADISSVGGGISAYFTEDTPAESGTGSNWSTQTSTSATPGSLNGGNNNALPVELSSFSASLVNNGVRLNWRTETEVNNYGFEVERKVSSKQSAVGNWAKIGFVEGHGNSNSPKEYLFIDNEATSGKYAYKLKQIDNDGTFEYSKIIEIDVDAPLEFELSQNYPNPFNPSTTIKYSLPFTSKVKLSVFNILGEEVHILINETKDAGIYTINFDALLFNSGIYFYKLETRNFLKVKKMSLIR